MGYEARARGVSRRNMRGDDARSVCPDIKLFSVPEVRGECDGYERCLVGNNVNVYQAKHALSFGLFQVCCILV